MRSKLNIKLLIFRIISLSIALFGITYRFAHPLGDSTINPALDMLGYYTVQSGIMACLLFFWLIITQLKGKGDNGVHPWFRGAVLLYIMTTSLVFLALLTNRVEAQGLNKIVLYVNHGLTAVLLTIDTLRSVQTGVYRWKYAFSWLIYPLIYYFFSIIELNFFYRSRYFFLNYKTLGIGTYLLIILLILITFSCLGLIFITINHNKKRKTHEKAL